MNCFTRFILIFTCFNVLWFQIVEGIAGGQDVRPGQFKYQVAIFHGEIYICVGVIISEWHIFTGSICILFNNEFIEGPVSVIGGIYNFEKNTPYEVTSEVIAMYVPILHTFDNPGASSSSNIISGEVAILKLKTQLNIGPNDLQIMQLMSSRFALSHRFRSIQNVQSLVAGYGYQTATVHEGTSDENYIEYESDTVKLKYLLVKILPFELCQRTFFIDPSTHVCAQAVRSNLNTLVGTCKGDEGSALIINNDTLVGILVKPPIDCNEHESVGLYARVNRYFIFIRNVLTNVTTSDIRVKRIILTYQRRNRVLRSQFPNSIYNY